MMRDDVLESIEADLADNTTGRISPKHLRDLLQLIVKASDLGIVTPQMFGAAADGETDDYPAIMAAIAATSQDRLAYQRVSGRVVFPRGKYYCSQTIPLRHTVHLQGSDSGQQNVYGTQLIFPPGAGGIVVHRADTDEDGNADTLTYSGGCSLIEGLTFVGDKRGDQSSTPDGIWLRATAVLRGCIFHGFPGCGIRIEANTGSDPKGNANLWRIENCAAVKNGSHGLYVQGQDANSGKCSGFDASGNGGWGVYESSFLGGTSYDGIHTAGNELGGYKHDGGPAVYNSPYAESDQSPAEFGAGAIVFNPMIEPAGIDPASANAIFRNGDYGTHLMRPLGTHTISADGSEEAKAFLGSVGGGTHMLTMSRTVDGVTSIFIFRHINSNRDLRFGVGAGDTGNIVYYTGANTGFTFGRSAPVPGAMLTDRLFLGGAGTASARNVTTRSAAPTSGEWARGDVVFNTAPEPGGYVGWSCVESGEPGTWKAFGLIED